MPTPEVVNCLAATRTQGIHLARTERVRERDGAATLHRHNSLTLCGAKIEKLFPYFSAEWIYVNRSRGVCPDCIAKWLKDQRASRRESVARGVLR